MDTTYAELTEKMRSMESEASLARQALVLRLLKGGDERMFQRLVEHSQGVCFVAIAILLDSEDGSPAGDEEGRKSYSCAAISRLAQQVLESEGASVAAVEEGTAAVILPLKHQHLPIHLVGMLEDLQGEIARTLGLSVTIGIGSVAENYDELRESFRYAQSCFRQRFFEGKGKVFHCDPLVVEEDSQTEAIYPDKREKRIVEAIKLQQLDKLEKEIDLWVKDIRGYSYHEVMFFINQFIGGLYKQLNVHSFKKPGECRAVSRIYPGYYTL
ncbi:hypothetical protein ABDI30_03375 [Paenibacillus cisolokensis]|uniref:hypothetical protein n=1 Tax=Paenibacillus cisolokensis TaxID=1658519 RepID=UPI003D2E963F